MNIDEQAQAWVYYQNLVREAGFDGITALLAEHKKALVEIGELMDALRPFSKAHQSAEPYNCVTLYDLRTAFNVMQKHGDDSTPSLQTKGSDNAN